MFLNNVLFAFPLARAGSVSEICSGQWPMFSPLFCLNRSSSQVHGYILRLLSSYCCVDSHPCNLRLSGSMAFDFYPSLAEQCCWIASRRGKVVLSTGETNKPGLAGHLVSIPSFKNLEICHCSSTVKG